MPVLCFDDSAAFQKRDALTPFIIAGVLFRVIQGLCPFLRDIRHDRYLYRGGWLYLAVGVMSLVVIRVGHLNHEACHRLGVRAATAFDPFQKNAYDCTCVIGWKEML